MAKGRFFKPRGDVSLGPIGTEVAKTRQFAPNEVSLFVVGELIIDETVFVKPGPLGHLQTVSGENALHVHLRLDTAGGTARAGKKLRHHSLPSTAAGTVVHPSLHRSPLHVQPRQQVTMG
jgi:hypothetical protein